MIIHKNSIFLEFSVEKQVLKRNDKLIIAEKSENYLYANFSFDDTWQDTEKYAVFTYSNFKVKSLIDENNMCKVPSLVINASGFYITILGENKENGISITTQDLYIPVSKNSLVTNDIADMPIVNVSSNTLEVKKENDILEIEIPNVYGAKLKLDEKNGLLYLLGKDENDEEVVLSSVDFAVEKILTNVYLDTTTNELIIEFINSQTVRIQLGDIFTLENYYTKEQSDNKFQKKLIEGEGISISEDGVISINYPNGDEVAY